MVGRRQNERKPARIEELLGPLEAELMNLLWMRGPSSVAEIEELLNRKRPKPLAYKTFLTICTRLSEKGLLTHEKEGRSFRYSALMTKHDFVARQASRAVDEMLDRFGHAALSNFVDRVAAEPSQLAALRDLLEEH